LNFPTQRTIEIVNTFVIVNSKSFFIHNQLSISIESRTCFRLK